MIKLKNILTEADVFNQSNTTEPSSGSDIDVAVMGALDDLEKDIKRTDLEPKKVNEALGLTLAGVALSLPEIIKLIGKLVNLLKKIPLLKNLSGDKLIARRATK